MVSCPLNMHNRMAYIDYGGCDYGECDYGGFYGECGYGE